jgi:2-amino-4-hydroxy-6-hydroxymethyldihydropteridine diphosphokinase
MKRVYLSLGSNMGDREQNLRDALAKLDQVRIYPRRISSLYRTAPVGPVRDQEEFFNVVVEAETALFPMQMLRRALEIERNLGRKRTVPQGPRLIDIDILLFGRFVIRTPQLSVPHLRMSERRFVLEPLAELVPDLRHPISKQMIRDLLAGVREQAVRKVDWSTAPVLASTETA